MKIRHLVTLRSRLKRHGGFLGPQIIGRVLQEEPIVPDLPAIDLQQEQQKAVSGNASILPQLQDVANKVNTFESGQLLKRLNELSPGYSDLLNRLRTTAEDQLSGNLSETTKRQLAQFSAERGAAQGTSGSGGVMSNFDANRSFRDFGLAVENQISKGIDTATRWLSIAQAGKGPMFDFTSMFITPQQQAQFDVNERQQRFQHDFVKNQINAEYSLGTEVGQAIIKTDDQIMAIAASLAGSASKGLMA